MSNRVMGLAYYTKGLTPPQKNVLVAMADHAHDDGKNVYPSVHRLSIKTSFGERTVRRALADLRKMKLVKIVSGSKYHASTEYEINIKRLRELQVKDLPERPSNNKTDLPERHTDLPERPERPARAAAKPSYNPQLNPHIYTVILEKWGELFPDKPQPKKNNKTLRGKAETRSKDKQFVEIWEEALVRASQSPTCNKESWFTLEFFLRNDQNYIKCYDRWMDWKDVRLGKPAHRNVKVPSAEELLEQIS